MAESIALTLTTSAGDESLRDEARLIAAARRGDGDAYGELVRQHQQRVFRLASRFFPRREDVEEIAQETFLQAWRKLDTYRARAPFEHWLTRVCLNLCYARLRRKRIREQPLEYEPAVAGTDAGNRLDARTLLTTLEPEDRFLLQLLHGEEWSVAEIAERLGWSRSNVKVRAHRARKRLRQRLEENVS